MIAALMGDYSCQPPRHNSIYIRRQLGFFKRKPVKVLLSFLQEFPEGGHWPAIFHFADYK